MEANELTDGIYVYFNCFDGSKIIIKVTGFKDGIVDGVSEYGEHWCQINKIEPIPLTPEILEKNGFERSKVFVEWKYENGNVYIIYKPFPYLKIQTEECIVAFPCEYIHQLQHALRLCGIEKEIIL